MNQRNQTAAEFLRLFRASGWSQAQLARGLAITPGAVSQLCHHKTRPRESTLRLLKRVLGERSRREGGPVRDARPLDPWTARVLADLERLPVAERRAIALVVRRMVKGLRGAKATGEF
jgi:transcriptional regulator with XRE-family HTH domain